MALSVASRVTSASNATHSPPACRAITAVSSAEARLLSTAKPLAPSCANRKTVARPLPIPSPGDCPAPTMMAILSLRRMADLGGNWTIETRRHYGGAGGWKRSRASGKGTQTAKLLATHPGPVMAVFVHVRSWHYRGSAGDG